MKKFTFILIALVFPLTGFCQESVDIDAEKQLIKEMVTTAFEVENQKDLEGILSCYAEDVIAQGPNMPQIQGLEALRNFYTEFFKILVSIEGGSTEVFISESGDMAWDYGWNSSVVNGPDGLIEDEGKYLQVLKKINGEWKSVAISFSSNNPAL